MKQTVHILGTGFSGLTLAYRLSERGIPVIVYDKKERTGGLIQTVPMEQGFAETAAHSISCTPRVEKLCNDLGLEFLRPSPLSKKRYIFRESLRRWPLSKFETAVLVVRVLFAKLTGRLKPISLETLAQWGKRNLGRKASHFLLETAMQGIYAGNADQLSASLILGPLFQKNRERMKGVISFKNGMSELIQALSSAIEKNGGKIVLRKEVALQDIDPFSGRLLVLATDVASAAEFLAAQQPKISRLLAQVEMLSLTTVTANFKLAPLPQGFGCLFPRSQDVTALGMLFNSSSFQRPWTFRSETWIYSGITDPSLNVLSDDEMKKKFLADRKKVFHTQVSPQEYFLSRWKKAFPHYTVQLEQTLTALAPLENKLQEDRIYLHGNYLGGIGLSKILERTDRLAEIIAKRASS